MKKIFSLMFFVLAFVSFAYGAEKNRIELTDGSVVEGNVVSLSGGQYTVQSPSLGTLKIDQSKVRTIGEAGGPSGSFFQANKTPRITMANEKGAKNLPSVLSGNADIMNMIPGLLANPDFQALVNDPEILNAAKSMDIKSLMANEKFSKFANASDLSGSAQKDKE